MTEDCLQNRRERKKGRIRAGFERLNWKLQKPTAGPTYRRCLEIFSIKEMYRNRREYRKNLRYFLHTLERDESRRSSEKPARERREEL